MTLMLLGQANAFSRLGWLSGAAGLLRKQTLRPARPAATHRMARWNSSDPKKKEEEENFRTADDKLDLLKRHLLLTDTEPSPLARSISPFSNLRQYHHQAFIPLLLDFGSKALLGVAGVTMTLLGLLYVNQESMLYIPQFDEDIPRTNAANPPGYRSPKEYSIPFEEAWITTQDGVEIHTWLLFNNNNNDNNNKTNMKKSTTTLPTIVFFHGNAGNIGIRLPNAQQMLERLNCNVLLVEYRGYGDSKDSSSKKERKPSEAGLKLDGEAAVEYVQNHSQIDATKIILFGRSLGGAVAFHVAQTWQTKNHHDDRNDYPPLAGMIVENTFCSIDDMADVLLPFLKPIKAPLLKMDWNSKAIADTLELPILYLAGQQDEIVPPNQMRELYERSKVSSRFPVFHPIPKGRHNDTWLQGGDLYWKTMFHFIQKSMPTTRPW